MNHRHSFLMFSALYLLSFAVLAGWLVLLFIGFLVPQAMALANQIAFPTLVGSVICVEIFKRLARRAQKAEQAGAE